MMGDYLVLDLISRRGCEWYTFYFNAFLRDAGKGVVLVPADESAGYFHFDPMGRKEAASRRGPTG